MVSKVKLYVNTIKYLKTSQIYFRVVNRVKRELYKRKLMTIKGLSDLRVDLNIDVMVPELDFDQEYLKRFDIEDILKDKFTFINITMQVDLSRAWNDKDLQHLWRYNLHYFEYFNKLAFEYSKNNNEIKYYKKFKYFIENWIDNNSFASGDGWHPYTISLRLKNWISVYHIFKDRLTSDQEFNERFIHSIYLQYKYLRYNLEKDVLGNHYFENIKALIVGSIFFKEIRVKERFKNELLEQLDEQILEDGIHFEMSPMYHNIILESLIKITYWLKTEKVSNQLILYLQKMINATYSFEENFGKTPAFNDSADGINKSYKILLETCKKYFDIDPEYKNNFNDSGFYIISDQFKKLIFDTGDICPTFLPAHAHCDALSFELSVNNKPVIINSGTYKYENGEWRDYFRSTKAHNTVTISGKEQSQYWGSFRVAKRIRDIKRKQVNYKDIKFYMGGYTSYHGDEHKRYIGQINENLIIILDYVKANVVDNIKSYLHFIPGTCLDIQENKIRVVYNEESFKIIAIGTNRIDTEEGWYSDQFNKKDENKVLVFNKDIKKSFYGYVLAFDSSHEIIESEYELKIVSDKELIINYEELGDML